MPVPAPSDVLREAACAVAADGRAVLCHVVRAAGSTPGKVGWKLLVRTDGSAYGNLGGGAFEGLVKADALERLAAAEERAGGGSGGSPGGNRRGSSEGGESAEESDGSEVKRYYLTEEAVQGEATGMVCGGFSEVFLEVVTARPVLLACGGGPVGQALAAAADLAGFEVVVADDRAAFRDAGLFPEAATTVAVDAAYSADFLAPWARRQLHVAIVTRCWETDTAALAAVLRQAPPGLRYLGLMGSRRKIARVRRELEARGGSLEGIELRAPIGLPVGGDSPGEIAIAIVAEVLAVRHGRPLAASPWRAAPALQPKAEAAAETAGRRKKAGGVAVASSGGANGPAGAEPATEPPRTASPAATPSAAPRPKNRFREPQHSER